GDYSARGRALLDALAVDERLMELLARSEGTNPLEIIFASRVPRSGIATECDCLHISARPGPRLQLISWGDGSGVPTSAPDLIIAGTDGAGLLHTRPFDG